MGIEDSLKEMMSPPFSSQIKFDFDDRRQLLIFSAIIYRVKKELPRSVTSYVKPRESHVFRPHETSFSIDGNTQVQLVQKVPYRQPQSISTRQLYFEFLQLAKKCHQILKEIAAEEAIACFKASNS